MQLITPTNVHLGVAGLLVLAGIGHALPGGPNKAQQKIFDFPGWFIICAGLLMLGTGVGMFFLPHLGVYFVSMCIGGTVTTAIVMPSPVSQKPGGVIFSLATLAAAFWSHPGALGAVDFAVCLATFAVGVAGVKFLPKNVKVNKMVKDLTGAKKDEKKDDKTAASSSSASGGAQKTAAGKKAGRTASPAPAEKKSDE